MAKQYSRDGLKKMGRDRAVELGMSQFGITFEDDEPLDQVVDRIIEAQEEGEDSDAEAEGEAESQAQKRKGKPKKGQDPNERVFVKISNDSGVTGNENVFFGVNGNTFYIQRESWVKVPRYVVWAMRNAQEKVTRLDGNNEPYEVEVPRFNIEVAEPE